jgi:hypothetical protein
MRFRYFAAWLGACLGPLAIAAGLPGCGSSDQAQQDAASEAAPAIDAGTDSADDVVVAHDAPRDAPAEVGHEAGMEASTDAGSDGPTLYPAFKPDIGQLVNQGGTILTSPKVVTVTWQSDTNAAALQAFDDAIGASNYWKHSVNEYGVGPATAGGHVVITAPSPNPWSDTALENWLIAELGNPAAHGFPAPDAETMYLVYTPANVTVTSGGQDVCSPSNANGYSGYHSEVTVGANMHVVYGLVVEKCNGMASVIDAATETGAHEIAEAATDPHVNSDTALIGFDTPHYVWEYWQGYQDEVGDACEYYPDAYYTEGADLPYAVQRLWSNKLAAEGHSPCVPVPTGAYFNVTPLTQETITATVPGEMMPTTMKGYRIAVGQTKTFSAGFYSDAPTVAWALQGVQGDGFTSPMNPLLQITTDRPTGNNGDMVNVTVKVKRAPAMGTAVMMTLVSTQGMLSHYMPIFIGAY